MVSRITVGLVLLVGALSPAPAARHGDPSPVRQSAVVTFERPTWVAGELLVGRYLIVHDEERMAQDGPCTALYRVGAPTAPAEEVIAFRCIPRERKAASGFTATVTSNRAHGIDVFDTLTEFQFAGDMEGHGVPGVALASSRGPATCLYADAAATALPVAMGISQHRAVDEQGWWR
jgi:hypothetical protein